MLAAVAAGEADVDDLAARFGVSASTVRRNLGRLSRQSAVTRTYGGAVLAPPVAGRSLRAREGLHRAARAAIAATALSLLVDEGEALILDGGATVEALGRLLRGRRLRVITANLPLIPVLAARRGSSWWCWAARCGRSARAPPDGWPRRRRVG